LHPVKKYNIKFPWILVNNYILKKKKKKKKKEIVNEQRS